jgi:hypothetical protein
MRCVDGHERGYSIRVPGCRAPGDDPAPVVADQHESLRPEVVGYAKYVRDQSLDAVRVGLSGAAGAAMASAIGRKHLML